MVKKLVLLVIEDDEIERIILNRICQNNHLECQIIEAQDGEKALEYLSTTESLPHIIMLDINMSKMNGIEVLKILKSNNRFKYIPIVVLSSSENLEDIKNSYLFGASGYVLKPLHMDDYQKKMTSILNYWKINEFI
jgi:CheY-like chemotaxis protein